jgi:hypothetical protein
MKTIKRGDEVKRVSEKEAMFFVRNGWNYCPKSEWKVNRKTQTKPKVEVEELEVTDNISDKKKRKMRKENKRKKYEAK